MDQGGNSDDTYSGYDRTDDIDNNIQFEDTLDDEMQLACMVAAFHGVAQMDRYHSKEPCRTSQLTGSMWVRELMNGHPTRCKEQLRMKKHVFSQLCEVLSTKYGLQQTQNVSVEESVAMFLFSLAHGSSNRDLQERFQHSGETVHRHFHAVLNAASAMTSDIIRPDCSNDVHSHIKNNHNYYPYFKDCIGALDGTHITARVLENEAIPFIGRKGYPTQNILVVCNFDMCFTFVSTGWEGNMHDTRILSNVLGNRSQNFPNPPPGKYYLVDSGYHNNTGFLAPYKGQRYHLPEFRRGDPPRNASERFNQKHSSLRSVIERTFDVCKARWKILYNMPNYPIDVQARITAVSMGIHNFIRMADRKDNLFRSYERRDNYIDDEDINFVETPINEEVGSSAYMNVVRDHICSVICGHTS